MSRSVKLLRKIIEKIIGAYRILVHRFRNNTRESLPRFGNEPQNLIIELPRKINNPELSVQSMKYIDEGKMIEENRFLKLTREGKLFADGIAAELFF